MATETQHTDTSTTQSSTTQSVSSGAVQTLQKETGRFQTFFIKFNNDWCMNFAGLLAYNLLMAMLPIAIALISILGFILGGNQALQANIIHQIASVFPNQASQQAIELAFKQLAKSAGFLLLIAILLAIFGGSRLFIAIEGCLDIIYRVRPRLPIRQNIMAVSMLLLFIVLTPIMVFTSALPTLVLSLLQKTPVRALPGIGLVFGLGGIVGGLIVAFILFEAIYFFVPNQRISWRNSWPGAVVAAFALELFLIIFPLYTTRFLGGYAGQIGFAVILLLFFYYFAVILLLGAEVNAFFFEGIRPIPNDLATFVSTMAGKLNRDIPTIEASTHQNAQPTERADRAHIARTHEEAEQIQQQNIEKARQLASSHTSPSSGKQSPKERGSSKRITAIEVLIGSALAMGIELLRLRGRK